MKTLNEQGITRLKSLLTLLDDEDNSIYNIAREKLISMGELALPYLVNYLHVAEPVLKERVREAYEVIASEALLEQMRTFCKKYGEEVDLEEGALLIARPSLPHVDMRTFSDLLNFFAAELRSRLDLQDAPEEIASRIGRYLSEEKGFSGVEVNYYDSDFHYVPSVLEMRRGVPISLSVIYLLVLRRLNLPVVGIGMPGHFIIRYDLGGKHLFADPSNGGKLLSVKECEKYLIKTGYAFKNEYLDPVSNKKILERMIRNLVLVFEKQDQLGRVQTLLRCIDILNSNV